MLFVYFFFFFQIFILISYVFRYGNLYLSVCAFYWSTRASRMDGIECALRDEWTSSNKNLTLANADSRISIEYRSRLFDRRLINTRLGCFHLLVLTNLSFISFQFIIVEYCVLKWTNESQIRVRSDQPFFIHFFVFHKLTHEVGSRLTLPTNLISWTIFWMKNRRSEQIWYKYSISDIFFHIRLGFFVGNDEMKWYI